MAKSNTDFKLSEVFIEKYKTRQAPFGYNGLGEFVFMRTYSRTTSEGRNELWWETVKRVVEGIYNVQKEHIDRGNLGWNAMKAQKSAQEMYDLIFNIKFLPSGRALWAMGTDIISEKRLSAALYNCTFVSTENLKEDPSYPFRYGMDMLMCGVGVGFDVRGAGTLIVKEQSKSTENYTIPDSREGWVESVGKVIMSFFGQPTPIIDYLLIRPEGAPIKTFGGVSAGYKPLEELHQEIIKTLSSNSGLEITQRSIVDIFNFIGKTVVAGNVRRSAEIALGMINEEFLNLKNYHMNPERESFGWASNNSIMADVGSDYSDIAERIKDNAEPGVIWLSNARRFGRMRELESNNKDFRILGFNPCGEIGLESSELCVVGSTRILTKNGYPKIKDVENKRVEVWNGEEWSEVITLKTNDNAKIIRVSFSDGSHLDCTEYHKFNIAKPSNKKYYKETEAKNLCVGDVLENLNFNGEINGIHEENAFEWGLFAGDGYIDKKSINVVVCGDKQKLEELGTKGKFGKPQIKEGYTDPVNRLYLNSILKDLDIAKELNNKSLGIPEYFFTLDKKSLLQFIAGWIETDGSVQKNPNNQYYRIYGSKQKMEDLQLLCRRANINNVSITLFSKKDSITNFGQRNQDLYYLTIPSSECREIPTRIKKINQFATGSQINNARQEGKEISTQKRQKVKSIEYLDLQPTYCFTENKKHKAVFNNVLTFQCNLTEVFPDRIETQDEFLRTLKYAYLFAKSVTLIETHWVESNRVMMRNRRLGVSITGIAQFIAHKGINELKNWLKCGYDTLKNYDDIYSDWFAVPKSIKLTCVKPSGTLSLLGGATPGVHYPESSYYIRRVRLANNSPLLPTLKKSGYKLEPAFGQENSTVVVEFPVFTGEGVKTQEDVSMWEQLAQASFMQKYWSDNAVSITVTFDPDKEGKDLERALDFYQYQLKGVSFLPKVPQGKYKQMPYEKIDQATYEFMVSKLQPLNFNSMLNSAPAEIEKYCNNDVCGI